MICKRIMGSCEALVLFCVLRGCAFGAQDGYADYLLSVERVLSESKFTGEASHEALQEKNRIEASLLSRGILVNGTYTIADINDEAMHSLVTRTSKVIGNVIVQSGLKWTVIGGNQEDGAPVGVTSYQVEYTLPKWGLQILDKYARAISGANK